jgi:ethanolamine utilization protein EutN
VHLGTVIGRVVATRKIEGLEGVKLLVVQPEDETGQAKGVPLVMTDGAGPAGPGDRVWWIEGREAALSLEETYVPVDAGIVAVVDSVDVPAAGGGGR